MTHLEVTLTILAGIILYCFIALFVGSTSYVLKQKREASHNQTTTYRGEVGTLSGIFWPVAIPFMLCWIAVQWCVGPYMQLLERKFMSQYEIDFSKRHHS